MVKIPGDCFAEVVLSPDCFNLAGAVRAIDDATDLDVQDAVWMPGHQVEEGFDCE